jgi:hypothetical protein
MIYKPVRLPGSPVLLVPLAHWPGRLILSHLLRTEMVALFILVFSVVALLKFAIWQWRAIWMSTARQPLSGSLQLAAEIDGASVGAQDFGTLMDLCDRLSPGLKKTSPWLREVSLYHRVVSKLDRAFGSRLPSLSTWANREMQTCSRYAAVVLDQSLSMNMDRQSAARAS